MLKIATNEVTENFDKIRLQAANSSGALSWRRRFNRVVFCVVKQKGLYRIRKRSRIENLFMWCS